jgi:hypothetical protein
MEAAPVMLRTILPTLDLEDNITLKNIISESPQEFRIVPYPATSFSQSNAVWTLFHQHQPPLLADMFVFVCKYSSSLED